jgi:hypothetical protein
MLHVKWVIAVLVGGLVIGAAGMMEPQLGEFDERSAAIAFASIIGLGYVVAVIRKLRAR